ncbi:3-phosphoshikimate 1-carboxyvinyltransferase [Oribacterium sp. KHPX15]|uniref:3-phosphoshikimate 1-carboxyvinyltransferase n=1 Tax=Oribacterium sp. KHPX15 TaxID=1855342 RepID=UPI00089BE3A7|nr:3-phosphoshikimate 1-carboxyvinyltransferase [Oribacterium sp. KHPX15]SDZ86884.1 3-phosphoshikimate 1-carboxyvinyltransferase [Oribacterium sp. KHPX15]
MNKTVKGIERPLRGELTVPGDKSISHRAVMLGSLSEGVTRVKGFLNGADCLSTIGCFRNLGIEIELSDDEKEVTIHGKGLHGLNAYSGVLDCGNSGTTTRLISGILSAQSFDSELTGDESIQKRPMKRIMKPLMEMGADITSVKGNDCAPLSIHGKALHGITYESPVASAQVKSSILFAGLYADGKTTVIEPTLSRDHSERMLRALGAEVSTRMLPDGRAEISIEHCDKLVAPKEVLEIPGDISSAAYFISAALLVPGSDVIIRNVGINPTRDGIIEAYLSMGADITLENKRVSGSEDVADVHVRYTEGLHGAEIGGSLIPRLIDELPVIAAVAAGASGKTVIKNASELKVKESNRIAVMVDGLEKVGVKATETEDGMIVEGQGSGLKICSGEIDTHKDHRIAMTFAVLALAGSQNTEVTLIDGDCINISYPTFYEDLASL